MEKIRALQHVLRDFPNLTVTSFMKQPVKVLSAKPSFNGFLFVGALLVMESSTLKTLREFF